MMPYLFIFYWITYIFHHAFVALYMHYIVLYCSALHWESITLNSAREVIVSCEESQHAKHRFSIYWAPMPDIRGSALVDSAICWLCGYMRRCLIVKLTPRNTFQRNSYAQYFVPEKPFENVISETSAIQLRHQCVNGGFREKVPP